MVHCWPQVRGLLPPRSSEPPGCCLPKACSAFPLSLSCPTFLWQIPFRLREGEGLCFQSQASIWHRSPTPPPSRPVGSNAPNDSPELSPACRAGSRSLLLGLPALLWTVLVNGQPGSPDSVAEAGALLRLGCLLALRCSASASLAPGSGQGSRAARTPASADNGSQQERGPGETDLSSLYDSPHGDRGAAARGLHHGGEASRTKDLSTSSCPLTEQVTLWHQGRI